MKATAVLLALLSSVSLASTTSTPVSTVVPGQYVLRSADNTVPAPFTDKTNRFDTLALCDAAAKSLKRTFKYKCDMSTAVSVTMVTTSTCSDEPAPRIYLPLVDLPDGNGSKGYELPEMEPPTLVPGSDTEFMPERDWLYVRNPKGDAAFPVCWVRGWEDPSKWRQNSAKEPGKVFMELVTPQNVAEVTELPNDETPAAVPPGFQEEWDARQAADAAACAAGDLKRCPQIPNQKPGACGWYWDTPCGGPGVPPA